jgi:hypothetical protein
VTMAYVTELDAIVEVWRDDVGWTARVVERGHERQTVIPHATALDAQCAIASVTPRETWVREFSMRAVAEDQPPL